MPVQDLREWIAAVEAMGELTRIEGADPHHELGGIVDLYQWDMGNPALLFDNIKGHRPGYRLLANVFTSLSRIALSLNLPLDYGPRDFVAAWRTQLKDLQPQPAVMVDHGPVLENQQQGDAVDISQFPAPVWHPGDGGRFLGTGGIVVMRDPDSGWINCGTYRVQAHDAQTVGLYISPGKHGRMIRQKYWERGEACPVAVSVGHDPLLLLLGGLEVDYGKNEYDMAGALRGEPIQLVKAPVTGLPVPASAEIVIEGEMPPDETHLEGPLGEWTGYYAGGARQEPVIHVRSVLHRDNPIVLGCIPGMPPNDNTYFRSPLRAALIWDELERSGIPGIVGVWSHEAGGGRMFNIVAIKQLYPGHAKQVGMATASCHAGAYANRYVVVVDDDIDPTDTNQVLWAMCTRTDVIDDIDVMKKCWSTPLDPMAYAGKEQRYYNNRMIIDACRPYDQRDTFPAVARVTEAEAKDLRARWPELFDAQGKVRKDVRQAGHVPAEVGR
jgi:UbiD family decarboxylase